MAIRAIRATARLMTVAAAPASLRILTIIAVVAARTAVAEQLPAAAAGGEIISSSLTPPVEAQQLGIWTGIGETDNVFLTRPPITSQTLGLLGLDFDVQHQGKQFQLETTGDFEYTDYMQRAFDDHLFGRFDGRAALDLIPGVWKWVVEDYFGQAQVDPFTPLTPYNLEYVNVFSTGPDFKFRLGSNGFVTASLRESLTHFQTSPLSGNRELASLAVGEQLSAQSSISLNVDEQRLRFEEQTPVNEDYDRRDAYARYELRGARTDIDFDLGVTQTNQSGTWVSAPLALLSLRRLLAPSLTLTLSGGHQATDASDSFRNLKTGAAGGIVVAVPADTAETYLNNFGLADLRFQSRRTTIALSARAERDSYPQSRAFDHTTTAVEAYMERRLTPVLALQLSGSWQHIRYDSAAYYETDWPIGAALVLTPAKHLEFKLRADRTRRDVVGPGIPYIENRILLSAEYRPWQ